MYCIFQLLQVLFHGYESSLVQQSICQIDQGAGQNKKNACTVELRLSELIKTRGGSDK